MAWARLCKEKNGPIYIRNFYLKKPEEGAKTRSIIPGAGRRVSSHLMAVSKRLATASILLDIRRQFKAWFFSRMAF